MRWSKGKFCRQRKAGICREERKCEIEIDEVDKQKEMMRNKDRRMGKRG
jgi:hypothetical protein